MSRRSGLVLASLTAALMTLLLPGVLVGCVYGTVFSNVPDWSALRAGAFLSLFLLGVPVMCAMAVSAFWVGRHGKMPDGVRTPAAFALRITSVAAIVYMVVLVVWAALLTFVQSHGRDSGLWSVHVGGGVICLAVGFLPMWLAETWACKWLFGSARHHEFC